MRRSLMNRGFGSRYGDDSGSQSGHTVTAAAGVAVDRKVVRTITVTEEVSVKAAAAATAGYHQSQRGQLQDQHDDEPAEDDHDDEQPEEDHDEEPPQDDHDEEPPQDDRDINRFQDNRGAGYLQERRAGLMQAHTGGYQASGGSFHEQRGGFVQTQQTGFSRSAAFGFSQEHRGAALQSSHLSGGRARAGFIQDDSQDHDQRRELGLRLRDRFLHDEKNGNLPRSYTARGQSLLQTEKDRRYASQQMRYDSLTVSERIQQDKWANDQIRLIGSCPGGFAWNRVPGGYVCSTRLHLVTDALLSEGNGGFYYERRDGQRMCGSNYVGPVYPGDNPGGIPFLAAGGSRNALMAYGNQRQIEDTKPEDKKSGHKSGSHKSSSHKSSSHKSSGHKSKK